MSSIRHLSFVIRHFLPALLLATAAHAAPPAESQPATQPAPRVLLLLAKGYNVGEFHGTYFSLRAAGYNVDVAAPEKAPIEAGSKNRALDWPADLALENVNPKNYFALAIPGGGSPANLEKSPKAIEIVQTFAAEHKPIAAICHGPRLLIRADVLKNRVATSLWKVKDELNDAWVGHYGTYLDQQVVEDDELTTARYPNDVTPFATAFLKNFERHAGLKIPVTQPRILVVGYGLTGPDKWVFSNALEPLNIKATFLASPADVAKVTAPKDFDLLVHLNPNADAPAPELTALTTAFQPAGDRKILIFPTASLATAGNILPQITAAAHAAAKLRPDAMPTPVAPPPTKGYATFLADPAFNSRAFIAAEAWLHYMNYAINSLDQPGADKWITGTEGYRISMGNSNPPETLPSRSIHIQTNPPSVSTLNGRTITAENPPEFADLRAMMEAATREPPALPAEGCNCAIILSPGFDEKAAVAAQAWFRAVKKMNVALIAGEKGKLRSLNGITLEANYTFDHPPKWAGHPLLIAPGGFYPDSLDKSRSPRAKFLADQYTAGATLYLFGTDSYLLAKEGNLKDAANWKWATTDQAVWSFDKPMGAYSPDPARQTAPRLYTVKSGDHLPDLLRLLDAEPKPASTPATP